MNRTFLCESPNERQTEEFPVCGGNMSNIIRPNETAPNDEWIIMSNQGTDCFLDLLITAADDFEKTEQQQELISFLKDQKDINTVAPGTAGFDLDEMAWQESTLKEDVEFLIRVTKEAQRERTFRKLPYEINTGIVIPWLERFAFLIDQMTAENLRVKSEFVSLVRNKNEFRKNRCLKDP